jgi:hypothetical protein
MLTSCMIIMLWKIKPPQCITEQEFHNDRHKRSIWNAHVFNLTWHISFQGLIDDAFDQIFHGPLKHIIAYLNCCKSFVSPKNYKDDFFFFLHILIIAKFGYIGLWMIVTSGTSQNWPKKNISHNHIKPISKSKNHLIPIFWLEVINSCQHWLKLILFQ